MKINELFKHTGISQSIGGFSILLDSDNCKIIGKTKKEDYVLLLLKEEKEGGEGHAYLRVQNKFKNISNKLLNLVFINENIIGLTLNQLNDLDINIEIESIQKN
jgi:hypothetical protein